MIPKPIAVFIVCAVTVVWLVAFAAQFLVAGYVFDGYLHTVFLIIVGGALGLSRKAGQDGQGGGGPGPDTPGPVAPPPPTVGLEPAPAPPPEPPREGGAHRAPFLLIPRAAI